MKIKTLSVFIVEIPMTHSFSTSFGTLNHKPTVLVRIEVQDGLVGWGEGSALPFPNYKPDTTDTTYLALVKYIAPQILGKTLKHPSDVLDLYKNIKGHNFAKTAVESALWMIYSLKKNRPLCELVSGTRDAIPVGESLGIKNSIEETLDEVTQRLDEGYRRIKLKIMPGWDVKLVETVRNKFDTIDLMVDGNSAYTLKHIAIFRELDHFNLTMIEQPLADDDIIDHATLQKQIKTPICLDESILGVEDARKAIHLGACKIINIKPGRVGGVTISKRIHDLCQEKGIGVWCGGMMETGIGRAYNIALASQSNFIYPADMSLNNLYFKEDIIEPTYTVDSQGYIEVSKKPGLGYEILEDRIEKYAVTKEEFSA